MHQEKTNKAIRKDAVVMGSLIESVPASWGRELAQEYFDMQRDVKINLLKKYGIDNDCMLSHIAHYDEGSPHVTDTFMPKKDGKFNFKNLCTKTFYQELGKVTWEAYKEFERTHDLPEKLEEPEWGNGRKHKEDLEYKVDTLVKEKATLEKEVFFLKDNIADLEEQNELLKKQQESLDFHITKKQQIINDFDAEIEIIENEKEYLAVFDDAKSSLDEFYAEFERFKNKTNVFTFKDNLERLETKFERFKNEFWNDFNRLVKYEYENDIKAEDQLSKKLDIDQQIKNIEDMKDTLYDDLKELDNKYYRVNHTTGEFCNITWLDNETNKPVSIHSYDRFGRRRGILEMILMLAISCVYPKAIFWGEKEDYKYNIKAYPAKDLQAKIDSLKYIKDNNIKNVSNLKNDLNVVGKNIKILESKRELSVAETNELSKLKKQYSKLKQVEYHINQAQQDSYISTSKDAYVKNIEHKQDKSR